MKKIVFPFLKILRLYPIRIVILFILPLNFLCASENSSTVIYKFDINNEIGPAIWRQTKQAIEEADALHANYILIEMNTYGGLLDAADSIRTIILHTKTPVIIFINNNAASAGALISIACDKIYMRSGANIGAATVVNQNAETLPDKYQSYMRSLMRSTAEATGRDPRIAEAMVDPSIYIEGIIDSGKVLTFTTSEAIQNGFSNGRAESIEEVLQQEGIVNYTIKQYIPSFIEKIIGLLVNPAVSGILIMIIIGGIYFELQSPGVGFPLLAAAIAATLYFAPLYLEGLAANWEVLLFIAGILLIGVEIFIIPGFGVAGILGITLVVTGLTLSLINNVGFDFSGVEITSITHSLFIVMGAMLFSLICSIMLGKRLINTTGFRKLILQDVQSASEGYTSSVNKNTYDQLVGKTGTAHTVLRPSGKVEIEGDWYEAYAEFGYIEKGDTITVSRTDGSKLMVNKL